MRKHLLTAGRFVRASRPPRQTLDELLHPGNKMILKGAFDELMQDVRCDQFVDGVGVREVVREGL